MKWRECLVKLLNPVAYIGLLLRELGDALPPLLDFVNNLGNAPSPFECAFLEKIMGTPFTDTPFCEENKLLVYFFLNGHHI